jgi:hypothetical protein
LYYSLIGGFSAPKIVRVLDATGYLTKPHPDATWRRLGETFELVVDILDGEGALRPGARAWLSVLRTRLLHSRVRLRLLQKRGAHQWNAARDGAPINQEDMVATLLAFSSNVLTGIRTIGAPHLSADDEKAYLHLWRYVGYLIGVDETLNPLRTECANAARGAVESIVAHLTLAPDESSRAVARNVLAAAANRAPLHWSEAMHAACARRMLGAPLADALHMPRPAWRYRVLAALVFGLLFLLHCCVAPFCTDGSWLERRVRRVMRHNLDTQLAHVPPIAHENSGGIGGGGAAGGGSGMCPIVHGV